MDYQEALQAFDGVMAGDGGLHRALHAGDPPKLCYGVKESRFTLNQSTHYYDHMDWLLYLKDALAMLGVRVSSGYPKYRTVQYKGETFGSSKLMTLTSPLLTEQSRRWYPDGVKEMPKGFLFTPVSLANTWMSDGNATRDKRAPVAVNVHLFMQNFSLGSIVIMEQALHSVGVLYTGRGTEKKGKSGVTITVLQKSVDAFMDIVKPHMLPSFSYKVKYRYNSEES